MQAGSSRLCIAYWLALEPTSMRRLVIRTIPRICVHSDTMLPTTCPQRLLASMAVNAATQATPVIKRKIVSECSRRNSSSFEGRMPFGCLLSEEPFSYRCLVMRIVTTTPVQSAMALPKNAPRWVEGSEIRYRANHKITTPHAVKLRECLRRNCFVLRLRFMELLYRARTETRGERKASCGREMD